MAENILADFEHEISSLTLIPSTGGVFEISVKDTLVYSKKETGRHPAYPEVETALRALL
ncbi:MAG: SelT/SelW/SelH family protein [Chloroflexi bacterium]|nr:SelT/SelW/SelH family protein [Chloroflexota bacterium]